MSTVLLISHDLDPGGVQRKIADVARCLSSRHSSAKASVYLILKEGPSSNPDANAFFDVVSASDVSIRYRAKTGFAVVPFSFFCFWCVFTLHPDRIIGFLRGPGILAVILRRVFWWRDIRVGISDDSFPSGAVDEQTRGSIHASALRRLMRMGYSRADWVAASSVAARTDLIDNFRIPPERVVVSHNWVVADEHVAPFENRGASVASPIPAGGLDLIYVGRLAPVKNLSLFVELVRSVREVRPAMRAAIVGDGPALADLERQRSEVGLDDHLILPDWQRDVTRWLRASRLFCITSHHEGLPIAALEAMALGVPVVSTRYPGADELVLDGDTGFLCADRAELVARTMQCLADDSLRKRLGRRASEVVATRFGADNLNDFVELIVRG